MPSAQQEIDDRRRDDLRRMVEVEAAIILMLRRARDLPKTGDASQRSEQLYRAAEVAALYGWQAAVRSSYHATAEQVAAATGFEASFSDADLQDDLAEHGGIVAAQSASAVTSSVLSEELSRASGERPPNVAAKLEQVAGVVAVSGFGRAREAFSDRLPRNVREELWVRRDTAGDRRVCDRCEQYDGAVAPASVGVQPKAPLHPSCRCSDTIISRAEADIAAAGYEAANAPAPRVSDGTAERVAARREARTAQERAQRQAESRRAAEREQAAKAQAQAQQRVVTAQSAQKPPVLPESPPVRPATTQVIRTRPETVDISRVGGGAPVGKSTKPYVQPRQQPRTAQAKPAPVETQKPDSLVESRLREIAEERAADRAALESLKAKAAAGEQVSRGRIAGLEYSLEESAKAEAAVMRAAEIRRQSMVTTSEETARKAVVVTAEQKEAIVSFTGEYYGDIRKAQMGLMRGSIQLREATAARGRLIEEAIAKNVQFEGELWRGIVVDERTLQKILARTELDWMKASTSTSTLQDVAESFAEAEGLGQVGVVFHIQRGRGLAIQDLGFDVEAEILQSGASRFRVLSKTQRPDEKWQIELEQIL